MDNNVHAKLINELFDARVYGLPIHFAARNEILALRKRIAELEKPKRVTKIKPKE